MKPTPQKTILVLLLLLLASCTKKSGNSLKKLTRITNKKILINAPRTETSSKYKFQNEFYPLEKDIYFDSEGNIIKYGVSKAEGMLYYYRNPAKNQLKLNDTHALFTLKLYKTNNLIIENRDTISRFEIDNTEKIIYYTDKNNRIHLYKFK